MSGFPTVGAVFIRRIRVIRGPHLLRDSTGDGRTRRSSEREPAVSVRDKTNVIGGWLPSLTYTCVSVTQKGMNA
jgi:hypothetical protein